MKTIELYIAMAAIIAAGGYGIVFTMAMHFWLTNGGHSPMIFWTAVVCAFFGPLLLGRFLTQAEWE